MTRLKPDDPIRVHFSGGCAAEGPVTLGQLNILKWLSGGVDPANTRLRRILDPPPATRIDDIVETIQVLLGRHEGLRTTVVAGDPPAQRLAGSVEVAVAAHAITDDGTGEPDRTALAAELHQCLAASPPGPEVALRVAIVTSADLVLLTALECSHLIADEHAMTLLAGEFRDMVADPDRRRVGELPHQPLDQARAEAQPRLRRRAEQALPYWAAQLERMPACLYALPAAGPVESGVATLASTAAAQALGQIATRTRTTRPSAVFAAVCAVLAQRGGYRECVVPILSGNRFDRALAGHVGTMAQLAVAAVDVAVAGFDELARRAWLATVQASSYGLFDVCRQGELVDQAEHRRGVRFCLEPVFNNVSPDTAGTAQAPAPGPALDTTLRWDSAAAPAATPPRFDLFRFDGAMVLSLTGSGCGLGRAEVERLLRAVERLLVAAGAGDLTPEQARAAIDLPPLDRGPDWRFVDSCWVHLGAVQRVLDDALAPAVAKVFADVDDHPLVAYLSASESIRTPAAAHTRTMAVMAAGTAVMAPAHYVVCEGAPAEPSDVAAWRRQPVIAAGRGRAG